MTRLRCFALIAALSPLAATAGWEYSESKPATAVGEGSEGATADVPAPRVQVFGRGQKPLAEEVSASDYAEMLKEDQSANSGTVVESAGDAEDSEFESLRHRLRTRQVAETAKVKRAVPPPPPLETQVITPQRAAGKKVKSSPAPALEPESPRGNESNPAFGYTHLLPSPFTLPQGAWVFGSSLAYGVFDFFQISTNAARLFQRQWNVQAKVPLIDFPTFIASAFVSYETFNPHQIDDANPDRWSKRWQPGLVTGYEISPDMAFFLGGNFSFGTDPGPVVSTSGYLHGAQLNMEWSWLYNPESSRLGNNALSLGMKYDLTYSMFGFGVTHHWKNFELGVHYTFADHDRFLPIFGFSAGASF